MKLVKSRYFPFFIIFLAGVVYSILLFSNTDLILNRGNDLDGFFWPIYNFVKQELLTNHRLPLWNNLFLAGTPLLSDPQSPIFYPPNIIFLLFPTDTSFLISFFLHFIIAGIGMYICSKNGFGFSKTTSILLACFYIVSPKFIGYLEAGHVGLVNSIAWIPFTVLATINISKKPRLKDSLLLGGSLALLYYSHLPTFLILAFSSGIFILFFHQNPLKKIFPYLVFAITITFGLTAVSLLPQLEWQKYSTRYLLLIDKDTYPKWMSILEPFKNILTPWLDGKQSLEKIDTEKWLAIGLVPTLLAFLGFTKLKTKSKLFFLVLALTVFMIVVNNASPLYDLLLKQDWYLLLRVSTRFWILIILAIIYLIGISIEKAKSKLIYPVVFLAVFESVLLGLIYLNKPIVKSQNPAPKSLYEYLSSDKSTFRVFCLNRCLSQKYASIYNLQLLDGYNTIQQKNFYQEAWQLTGTYWNYYTLSIPPLGTLTEKLKPDIKALGKYNVKYLISPYPINNKDLIQKNKIENYYIYENKLFFPRSYFLPTNNFAVEAPLDIYQPNYIKVNTSQNINTQIILSEVFSPGWKAYLDSSEEVTIQETPNALRAVDIKANTKFVIFRYNPNSFRAGKIITIITVFVTFALVILVRKNIDGKTAFFNYLRPHRRKV